MTYSCADTIRYLPAAERGRLVSFIVVLLAGAGMRKHIRALSL